MTDKDFIVAIELGSSKIVGIAGRKKDGTMQVIAYAEEKTASCVKRGLVYNVDKTTQCVNSVLNKLEQTLKTRITRVYVGLAGQSIRSYKCVIKRNMITNSYITAEVIDKMREESYEIPFSDYEVLENVPQEYIIDQVPNADPVGVMGQLVDGEFLNVIAKTKVMANIKQVFANTEVDIVDSPISALKLADNVLTDSEKRSGCVLVDLGADTTTVVIFKNNIVRSLVTLPLGMNNINKDLASIQIEGKEAEDVKLKYGNANADEEAISENEPQTYTTTDGHNKEVQVIRSIIMSRVKEIIANVKNQINKSNYSDKLLAGMVLTGGGANMKGIDKAFASAIVFDKVRIARDLQQNVVKTSAAVGFSADNGMTNTLVSILLSGDVSCSGPAFDGDLFESQQKEMDRQERLRQQAAIEEKEKEDAVAFDQVKTAIRERYSEVQKTKDEVIKYGADKAVRERGKNLSLSALDVLGPNYDEAAAKLDGKEKFKQSLHEGDKLAEMLRTEVQELTAAVQKANNENKWTTKLKNWFDDILNEDVEKA